MQSIKIPLEPIEKPKPLNKGFFKRWKEGIKTLPPDKQIKAKMHGHMGAAFGLTIAVITLIYRTITNFNFLQLGFTIFLAFLIYIQIIEGIGAWQKYKATEKMMEQIRATQVNGILGNL